MYFALKNYKTKHLFFTNLLKYIFLSISKTTCHQKYFTINGVHTSVPQKGVNILKRHYSDGSVQIMKIILK